jgi:hypothetical protein
VDEPSVQGRAPFPATLRPGANTHGRTEHLRVRLEFPSAGKWNVSIGYDAGDGRVELLGNVVDVP